MHIPPNPSPAYSEGGGFVPAAALVAPSARTAQTARVAMMCGAHGATARTRAAFQLRLAAQHGSGRCLAASFFHRLGRESAGRRARRPCAHVAAPDTHAQVCTFASASGCGIAPVFL
jgi:hypothetical protein